MDAVENSEALFHSTLRLADLLCPRAEPLGEARLHRFLETLEAEGSLEEWSAAHLDTRARALGTWLRTLKAAGERVLLLYPPGLDFVTGFMGCLYVGAIAVPYHPPDPSRLVSALPQLVAIARDSGARFVLTTSSILEMSPVLTPEAPELAELHWVATDMVPASLAEDWKPSGALTPPSPLEESRCLPAQFRAQVTHTPDAVAVAADEETLTYAQLDAASDALAWHLREHGVSRGVRVGLCVERSTRMVVAMLGILKAGGAFVPLDPACPREHLAAMMEDSRARVLVTESHRVQHLPVDGVCTVLLDSQDAFELELLGPPRAGTTLEDPACVLYPAGASGKPTGVTVPHRSVADFFSAMDARVGAAPVGTWLAVTRVSCDSSMLELLWSLVRGFRVAGESSGLSACARATAALP
ncbi:AMP-binding protein [Corallococcus interemptor]|uniref:AMP-binding protein n=1 Tax=Corallococcus interemptor TaxID=2316720 RepID=UPI003CFE0853